MKIVMKIASIIAKCFAGLSMVALVVMLVVTLADVILRFVFNSPITGATEIARMMMVCMIATLAAVLFEKRHIRVDFVVDKFGRKGQLAFDTVGYLLSAAVCGLMSYQGFLDTLRRYRGNHVYSLLMFPTWPFYLLYAVATGIFAICVIICLIDNFCNKDLYKNKPTGEDVSA